MQTLAELKQPLAIWEPKAWYYASLRFGLKAGSFFSRGLAIGQKHGFDSGVMLDHVYENKPKGSGPLGRFIDRCYLNSIGWVGIRNRGSLVQKIIKRAIAAHQNLEGPVRFADLACGGGRYALGALHEMKHVDVDAVLRDYEPANTEKARTTARKLGVEARIENADAFNRNDLDTLGERDVVVVSGLHEIIEDDDLVRHHFHQVARVLRPGGTLIVTIQPDHPQLELIARALKSHTGRPWTMRLRSKSLTTNWIKEAGFTINSAIMEETGIFGVIVATRRGVGPADKLDLERGLLNFR